MTVAEVIAELSKLAPHLPVECSYIEIDYDDTEQLVRADVVEVKWDGRAALLETE